MHDLIFSIDDDPLSTQILNQMFFGRTAFAKNNNRF